MKVLWFSVTPSLYGQTTSAHNGGGWIASLERIVRKCEQIRLAVAFMDPQNANLFKVEQDNVTYYPITIKRSLIGKIKDRYTYKEIDKLTLLSCNKVIKDFQPDVIHVFGSEWCFGLIKQFTNIPVIIHMQGCWPPYRNAAYPPGYSYKDKLFKNCFNPLKLLSIILQEHLSKERSKREELILSQTAYFMGRTQWDYALTKLYAPRSRYFYCSEALRSEFMDKSQQWNLTKRSKYILVTVGGGHTLKGLDVVLRTADLLTKWSNVKFEWRLLGPTRKDMKLFESLTKIQSDKVNVYPLGRKSAMEVKEQLLGSDIYIHTAYIDNSPNSICEAQFLGLPIISTNVGGILSLFPENYPKDLLVPANDPYFLAYKIKETLANDSLRKDLSIKNMEIARVRHSEQEIISHLLRIYLQLLK